MKVTDLKGFIQSKVTYRFLVNSFHSQAPDDSCTVVLSSAGSSDKHVTRLLFQFLVRAKDPEKAEKVAHEIYEVFDGKSGYQVGSDWIVLSQGQQSIPLYTGVDSSDRHIYSVNIVAIVDKK